MPERVDAAIERILSRDPLVEVRFTDAVTPDSYLLHYRSLYVHPSHREAADRIRAERGAQEEPEDPPPLTSVPPLVPRGDEHATAEGPAILSLVEPPHPEHPDSERLPA